MKMKKQKPFFWILVLLALSLCTTTLLSVGFLRLSQENKQKQEQLERDSGDYYLTVMYSLDAQRSLYQVLGNLAEKAAQYPEDEGLRIYLNGIADGVQLSRSGVEENLYEAYTELFAKNEELAQSVQELMHDVLYVDRPTLNFADLSSTELEEISNLYRELEKCFFRADSNFGDLLINRKFEDPAFQNSMDKIYNIIAQLGEYHTNTSAEYSLFEYD